MKRSAPLLIALLLDLLGSAGALLAASRTWQTVTTPRPAPLRDDLLRLTGRDIDAAPTALALVALAGVVAVLATRGLVRRIVGGVLALAGTGLIWRSVDSAEAVSARRARELVREHRATVDVSGVVPHVDPHALWPILTGVCGMFVLVAGSWIAWRGNRWQVMSARYETPAAAAPDDGKAAAGLWSALDRGEDPTDRHR